jgi:hypothetical protein
LFPRLILTLAIIALLLWGLNWFRRTPPHRVVATVRKAAVVGGIGLLLVLVVTGRLNPVFAALAAAIPAVLRLVSLLHIVPTVQQVLRKLGALGTAGTAGNGQTSSIRTRFVDMSLDHASGRMDGIVREGPLAGRRLSELTQDQVVELLALCRAQDPQSATLVETYLDRERGDAWREQDRGSGRTAEHPSANRMDRDQALRILGLAEGATAEEVRAAHRRLMQRFHPDRGGSDYLAAMINEAKRLLLGD